MGRARFVAVYAVVCCALLACGTGQSQPGLRVFAAASLSDAFEALARAYEAAHPGVAVQVHCAGTQQLVLQLRQGAEADLFASADRQQMQRAVELGLVAGSPEVFAHNQLVVAVPAGNPQQLSGVADLTRGGLRVVLCGPEVPAGRYARDLLRRAGVDLRSVSDEPSVAAAVGKLLLSEVDAALVYATDVGATAGRLEALPIAAAGETRTDYLLALLAGSAVPDRAADLAAFVGSPAGRRILVERGFEVP